MGFISETADQSAMVAKATTKSMVRALAITAIPVLELALAAGLVYGIIVLPMRILGSE